MSNLQEAHPLDNSALIHLAVHNKWHSNVFRLEIHLRSAVRPARHAGARCGRNAKTAPASSDAEAV